MSSYGIELWGAAKKSNIKKLQTLQSKSLRRILNAPPYVSNETIHKDLHLLTVKQTAISRYKNFHKRLLNNSNPLITQLSTPTVVSY